MSDKNIVSLFHKKARPIAIVMDEIDGMNNGDKGGINALIKLIRPKKTKKQKLEEISNNPIICISNYHFDKKIKELMKMCVVIEIKKPTTKQIIALIKILLPDLKDNVQALIAEYVNHDLRKLNEFISLKSKYFNLLENDILSLQDLLVKIQTNRTKEDIIIGESQNLRDKEIIEFLGDN